MKQMVVLICALALAAILVGCGQQQQAEPEISYTMPTFYDSLTITHYKTVGDSGYQFLDEEKVDEAVAAFGRQIALIPACSWGYYNMACVYGRTKQLEPGLEWLAKTVEHGWSDAQHLQVDSDMEALRDDPRFAILAARADSLDQALGATFTRGLPTEAEPPTGIKTMAAVNEYYDAEKKVLTRHRRVWSEWEYIAARLDLEVRLIKAISRLPAAEIEADFDEGIARVRALGRIQSVWSSWGPISGGVLAEADRYLKANPATPHRDEANYFAGLAAVCRFRPADASSPHWASTVAEATPFFDKITSGSEWAGPAQGWKISFALQDSTADRAAVNQELQEFAATYREDKAAIRVAAMNFHGDLVEALWPIQMKATDIDGKEFSLADYKGKPVLIDFWATWCGPCRGELPYLKKAWKDYRKKGLEIVSISLDYSDRTTPDEYRQWIEENGMSWRHIYDQDDWQSALAQGFFVYSIPSPFLVDQNGELVAYGEGLRQEELDKALASLF